MDGITERQAQIHDGIGVLVHIARMHHRNLDRISLGAGLNRSPCMLLLRMADEGELPSQRELATHFDISPACIARTIKQLTADGLIAREESREDPRRNRISITEEGIARARQVGQAFDAFDARAFQGFSDEELVAFTNTLRRIEQNIFRAEEDIDKKGSVAP